MKQSISTIVENTRLCSSVYRIDFILNHEELQPLPGQFLTARISRSISPLLRRPFAFSHFEKEHDIASFIYQVRGEGTTMLSSLGTMAELDIIAPLGTPFPLPGTGRQALLVAGGIGLGPVLFLAETLVKKSAPFHLVFGCRNTEHLPRSVFDHLPATICTDDGSTGFHGTVAAYLNTVNVTPETTVYACGPRPMLQACHQFAQDHNLDCFVSVEQTMACGIGACMGCAVKVHGPSPYVRACKEGPVFNSKDLIW